MSTEAGWELPEIRLVPYAIPALWWQLLPAMLQYGSKKNIDNTECISRQLISLCQRLTHLNNHHSTIYSNQDMKSKEVFTDKWLDNHYVVDIYNEIFFFKSLLLANHSSRLCVHQNSVVCWETHTDIFTCMWKVKCMSWNDEQGGVTRALDGYIGGEGRRQDVQKKKGTEGMHKLKNF